MTDKPTTTLEYQRPPRRRGAPAAVWVALLAAVVADLALPASVFIWNGGRYWGPYLYPPVTIFWARPIFLASVAFGIVALFASGIGLIRQAAAKWKIAAATASIAYWLGFACIVNFGLI